MRTFKKIMIFCSLLFVASCGAVSDFIAAITSVDCDDFLLNELSTNLADECRDLEGYLDVESTSLESLGQILPISDLTETGQLFFQLTDVDGNPLTDLTAENTVISVSTDGGEMFTEVEDATLTTLSEIDETRVSLLAVIDYSASILDEDLDDIVSGLDIFFGTLGVGYEGAVVKFSDDVSVIQNFTENEDDILAAVDDTSYTRASTSLYDAIYDGSQALGTRDLPLRLMVLFTDGIDNDSTATLDEAIQAAQDNDVAVCVVGVTFADTDTLERIAEETGCFYIYKPLFSSLDAAFQQFAEQFNSLNVADLPDSFDEASGIIKVAVDVGEDLPREFESPF